MNLFERIGRQALFALDAETAHGLSIAALKCGVPLGGKVFSDDRLKAKVAGIEFPNPLGLAAGYDKNAVVPDALLAFGFGFVEIGTVTPLPQAGNEKPRIFRLPQDEAVVNRLGFNNQGHEAVAARLAARVGRAGVVGVNIGANKDSADRIADYALGAARFARHASYLTVNISSPNTPGLRAMQARESLAELLTRVVTAREAAVAGTGRKVPLFLKIAPDLDDAELADIAIEVLGHEMAGVVVSNTTIARTGLTSQTAETGGLSGKPLFERSTIVLAKMRRLLGPKIAIVGVGGVGSAQAALEKIRAGADLVQLYTGMIYAGPALPARILRGMIAFADAEGLQNLAELRDSRLDHWADKSL